MSNASPDYRKGSHAPPLLTPPTQRGNPSGHKRRELREMPENQNVSLERSEAMSGVLLLNHDAANATDIAIQHDTTH